jgi:hypothetical protein
MDNNPFENSQEMKVEESPKVDEVEKDDKDKTTEPGDADVQPAKESPFDLEPAPMKESTKVEADTDEQPVAVKKPATGKKGLFSAIGKAVTKAAGSDAPKGGMPPSGTQIIPPNDMPPSDAPIAPPNDVPFGSDISGEEPAKSDKPVEEMKTPEETAPDPFKELGP